MDLVYLLTTLLIGGTAGDVLRKGRCSGLGITLALVLGIAVSVFYIRFVTDTYLGGAFGVVIMDVPVLSIIGQILVFSGPGILVFGLTVFVFSRPARAPKS